MPSHDTFLNAIAEYSPAARVFVSAAIISSVMGASAAAGGRGGVRRMAFVNARLVPCLFRAGVARQVEAVSLALSRGGGAGAAALEETHGAQAAEPGQSRAERLLDAVGDGFHDVVDGFAHDGSDGGSSDGFKDARLMTQIGMVLGFIYLAFLTVWFWATRRGEHEGA
jgi:hypothetical protein